MKKAKSKKVVNQPTKQNQYSNWQSIKHKGQGYAITVQAKPNSKTSKVTQVNQEYVGVSIAAPPREGQANEQLVAYLAGVFIVKKSSVYVDKGGKSKHKIVIISECKRSFEQVLQLIKAEI